MRKIFNIFGIIKILLIEKMHFRFNFVMALFSSFLYSMLFYMLWKAIYQFKPDQLMDYQELITYVLVAQACNFSRWSPAERTSVYDTARRIQSGDIALDLLKPFDFQTQKFCEASGFFLVEFLFVNIPLFLFFIFFFHINLPPDIFSGIAFLGSLIIAFFTAFMLNQIFMVLSFWTYNAQGLQIAKKAIVDLFAGTLIPFEFFPKWLKLISTHLPFQAMTYLPVSIYTGRIHGEKIFYTFIEQIFWCFIMFAMSRMIFKKLVKRLTIFGG